MENLQILLANPIINYQTLAQIAAAGGLAIPAINGLIKIFIRQHVESGRIKKEYIPAISVGFGLLIAPFVLGLNLLAIPGGILLGMASTGLYEFKTKTVDEVIAD